jgi:hypothetical protein
MKARGLLDFKCGDAMADDKDQLTYELNAEIGKFSEAFKQATSEASASFDKISAAGSDAGAKISASIKSAVSSVADSFDKLQQPAKQTGDVIGALIGGGIIAGAAAVATTMGELINALASAGDRADDLRLPVNIIQALKIAADEARVPTDKLNGALDQFTSNSKKAAGDLDKFFKALNNIGPSFAKAFQNAPTQAQRLRIVMEAFRATTDEVKRAQLAQEAFGSDNERLIAMMSNSSGMEGYIQEVRKLGLEIDESAVKKAQEAKSALSLLAMVMTDELSSALAELIPSFTELLPVLEKVAGAVRDTVAGYAKPENRPLATLKNDAIAAQEQITELQADLKALDNYKPATGIVGGVAKHLGLDVETATDKSGGLQGVAVDIEGARKRIQAQIADTQTSLDKYNQLIAQKQIVANANKGKDGTEAPAFKPRPKLDKDDDDDSKAFDKETASLNKHIATMKADTDAIGLSNAAHQGLRAELGLLNAAHKDDDKITTAQIDKYAQLRQSMSAQQALVAAGIKLNKDQADSFSQVTGRMTETAAALDAAKMKFEGINGVLREAGDQMVDIFQKAMTTGVNFGQVMQGVLQTLEKQLLQAALTGGGAFGQLFGTASTTPGAVGGLMGGLVKLFGGARAGGGDIDGGKAYLVGENGPEIMLSRQAASIIPHHKIAVGGGTRNQTTNNHVANVTVNASGGNTASNQDLAEKVGRAVQDSMARMTQQAIRNQSRPGGTLYR